MFCVGCYIVGKGL